MEFEMFLKPLLPEQIRQMVNVQEKLISFDRQGFISLEKNLCTTRACTPEEEEPHHMLS